MLALDMQGKCTVKPHAEVGGEQHDEASRAHTRKAGWFDAKMRSLKRSNNYPLRNKVEFHFHNANKLRARRYWSSAMGAECAIACLEDAKSALAEVPRNDAVVAEHRNKALKHHPDVGSIEMQCRSQIEYLIIHIKLVITMDRDESDSPSTSDRRHSSHLSTLTAGYSPLS